MGWIDVRHRGAAADPETGHRDSPQVASGQIPALLTFVVLTFGWPWTPWIEPAGLLRVHPALAKPFFVRQILIPTSLV